MKGGRDADPRQQTLRATIEWSHDLLSEHEQVLFHRLSVFAGGCTLEAAEQVCGADLDALASLVDKSLLRQSEGRFWMLETIREYGIERLEQSDEAGQLRDRHSQYYLDLAEHVRSITEQSPEQHSVWLPKLDPELDNFRQALAGSLNTSGLRFANALQPFWLIRGRVAEGREWLDRILEGLSGGSVEERAKALGAAGDLAAAQGDYGEARRRLEQSVALFRAAGDRRELGRVLCMLASMTAYLGDAGRAEDLFEESLTLFREVGEEQGCAAATVGLADLALYREDFGQAQALSEKSLSAFRDLQRPWGIAISLGNLGWAAAGQRRFDRARELFDESLSFWREIGYPEMIAGNLLGLAASAGAQGDTRNAASLLGSAEAIHDLIGARFSPFEQAMLNKTEATLRRSLDPETIATERLKGRALVDAEPAKFGLSG